MNTPISKPDMDNFVKYVISITSLENTKSHASGEINDMITSKFDILSARTIDEVEYLISLENELQQKVRGQANLNNNNLKSIGLENTMPFEPPKDTANFSAMDNLDLYKTVSSLAQSVISLSNTLNKSTKLKIVNSPSLSALERRMVMSSFPALNGKVSSSSKIGIEDELVINITPPRAKNDGPQRLVFHDDGSTLSLPQTPTKSNRKSNIRHSSPLKNVLPNLNEVDLSDSVCSDDESFVSTISYDSLLSSKSFKHKSSRRSNLYSRPLTFKNEEQTLKKKTASKNLREFTFETSKLSLPSPTKSQGSPKATHIRQQHHLTPPVSLSPTDPLKMEAEDHLSPLNKLTPQTAIRPASGRISILRKSLSITQARRNTYAGPPKADLLRDPDFIKKERSLIESEHQLQELQDDLLERTSLQSSVATDNLFNSRKNSPKKVTAENKVRLSTTPSIYSILDDSSLSSGNTSYNDPARDSMQFTNDCLLYTSRCV